MVTPRDIRRAYEQEAHNERLVAEWAAAKRKARKPAARKGRIGNSNPGGWRATRSLPSGQPVSWETRARSVLTLAAFLGLVGAVVAIRVGTAVIQGRRYRR